MGLVGFEIIGGEHESLAWHSLHQPQYIDFLPWTHKTKFFIENPNA